MSEPGPPIPWPPVGTSTSSGTWDDWLALRPEPTIPPGENSAALSDADYVAKILAIGHPEVLDFGIEIVRNGMRDLFAEFEASTRGQTILWRKPEVRNATYALDVIGTDERQLRVMLTPDSGQPAAVDLDPASAMRFAHRVASELERIIGPSD